MSHEPLLVHLKSDKHSWSKVWDGVHPMGLGSPTQYVLIRNEKGISVRDLTSEKKPPLLISAKQIENSEKFKLKSLTISCGFYKIQPIHKFSEVVKMTDEVEDNRLVTRLTKYLAATILSFIIVLFLAPIEKPKVNEELIPAQYAKIIMKAEGMTASAQQQKNIAHAFKSKSVQNSLQQLFKKGIQGRINNLLKNANAPSLIGKSSLVQALSNNNQEQNIGTTKVTMMGGGAGSSTDYASGQSGSVSGQGQGFVSLNAAESVVEEGLTKDEVGAVIHKHMNEIRYCYESAMIHSPDIEGKLVVEFSINPQGKVVSSKVKNSTVPDPRVDQCIISRLNLWVFPKPKGNSTVAVMYPFIFKTLGR